MRILAVVDMLVLRLMSVNVLCVSKCYKHSEGNAIVILCQFISFIHTFVVCACFFICHFLTFLLVSAIYGHCCVTDADKIIFEMRVNAVR